MPQGVYRGYLPRTVEGVSMRATRRRPATPAEAKRALAQVHRLFSTTPLERARYRFADAKAEYDAATRALMAQEPGASERADAALEGLNAARAALRLLDEGEQQ
jgi:hypothetical protein